jgi:hypothetical protein
MTDIDSYSSDTNCRNSTINIQTNAKKKKSSKSTTRKVFEKQYNLIGGFEWERRNAKCARSRESLTRCFEPDFELRAWAKVRVSAIVISVSMNESWHSSIPRSHHAAKTFLM